MTDKEALALFRKLEWITFCCHLTDEAAALSKSASGLNLTQTRMLFHAALCSGRPIGRIAASLNLKASTATAASANMEALGFITRVANPNDRRSMVIAPSEKAYKLFKEYPQVWAPLYKNLLSTVKDKGLNKLQDFLTPDGLSSLYEGRFSEELTLGSFYELLKLDPQTDADHAFLSMFTLVEYAAFFLGGLSTFDSSFDVSLNEARILRYLLISGNEASLKATRKNLNIKTNIMSVCLDKLQKLKLIERFASESDRRSVIITLTDKGYNLITSNQRGFDTLVETSLPHIKDTDYTSIFKEPLFKD